ncbi:MAG: CmcJ/NvfI family oxidoreductase [Burkholderiaceae bacterium]
MADHEAHRGRLNYMADEVKASLYRNGKVLTRRDPDGSDSPIEGLIVEKADVHVQNARLAADAGMCTVLKNGFELIASPMPEPTPDFLAHAAVIRDYYPDCERIVRKATGASLVRAFDHNVRSAAGKKDKTRIKGGQQVQGPAHMVHGDYTLTSAPQRLRDLTQPPGENDTLRAVLGDSESLLDPDQIEQVLSGGHFAIINVWRNIAAEPVQTHPLALCDGQSVAPQDLVVFEIHYQDRVGENYFARISPEHRWFYFPQLTRDEALLIKQWDSRGTLAKSAGNAADSSDPDAPCTFSFHTAFRDPDTPEDAPSRWSIEVRCVAVFDGM